MATFTRDRKASLPGKRVQIPAEQGSVYRDGGHPGKPGVRDEAEQAISDWVADGGRGAPRMGQGGSVRGDAYASAKSNCSLVSCVTGKTVLVAKGSCFQLSSLCVVENHIYPHASCKFLYRELVSVVWGHSHSPRESSRLVITGPSSSNDPCLCCPRGSNRHTPSTVSRNMLQVGQFVYRLHRKMFK